MRLCSDGIKAMSRGFFINPEACAKMAGIVNKVYLPFSISRAIFRETSKKMDVHAILKNKSTTFFHGQYSYRTKK